MKKVVLATLSVGLVVSALATAALAAPSGTATQACKKPGAARMSIPALHWRNKPVSANPADTSTGPIWDVAYLWHRPGQGKTLVVDGHDVTPVKGFPGGGGPYFNLHTMHRNQKVIIVWRCTKYVYKTVTRPFAIRQCISKSLEVNVARLNGVITCPFFNRPINKRHWSVETLFMRSCWPQRTRKQFLYERAVLVRAQPTRR